MNKNLFVSLGLLCLLSLATSQDFFVEDGEFTEGIILEDPGHDINYDYDSEWNFEGTEGIVLESGEGDINYGDSGDWDFEGTEGIVIEFGEGDINYGDSEDWEFEIDFESGDDLAFVDVAEPMIAIDEFISQDEVQNNDFLARL